METRQLGHTDLQMTPIGPGAWAIGVGGWQFGWGEQNDAESIDTIHRALDRGINWIDTAPVYGVGHSEEGVGRALAGRGGRPYIFTKCGLRGDKRNAGTVHNILKAESIRREVDESLRRGRSSARRADQVDGIAGTADLRVSAADLRSVEDLFQQGGLERLVRRRFSVSWPRRPAHATPRAESITRLPTHPAILRRAGAPAGRVGT